MALLAIMLVMMGITGSEAIDNAIASKSAIYAIYCNYAEYALFSSSADQAMNALFANEAMMANKAGDAARASKAVHADKAKFSPKPTFGLQKDEICNKTDDYLKSEKYVLHMTADYKTPCGPKSFGGNGQECVNDVFVKKAENVIRARRCVYGVYAKKARYAANTLEAAITQNAKTAVFAQFAKFAENANESDQADSAKYAQCL